MDRHRKIVFFLGSMGRGGAERVISILSKDYAERGWKTDIAVLLFPNVDYELHKTTQVLDFSGKTKSRLLRIPQWLKYIRAYVKKEKPDCVVSFAARINLLVILACVGLNQRIIISERNDPRHDGRGKIADMLTKILYPFAEKIVFQTQRAKVYFDERIQKKGIVISNPISVAATAASTESKKIVAVGRLTEQKNHKMLIYAFSKVCHIDDEYTLEMYGDGNLKAELQQLTVYLGLAERVIFHGNVSDVHQQIADAAMFVLSSDYEGLSNALLEAMMMGLPCISTNCAGADEYIMDGENGLLVPVGDQKAMEKALAQFISDKEFRKACGAAAKETSLCFAAESILDKWHELID